MPCFRHTSPADNPAACSFSTLMICSSVNLLLRMSVSRRNGLYPKSGTSTGSTSPRHGPYYSFRHLSYRYSTHAVALTFSVCSTSQTITIACEKIRVLLVSGDFGRDISADDYDRWNPDSRTCMMQSAFGAHKALCPRQNRACLSKRVR